MWNFLRSSQGGAKAAEALSNLIRELSEVEGSLSAAESQVVAANSYLIWAEKAERQLLDIYEDFTIPRQLHSDRYWQIRSVDFATSRPMALMQAEIRMQARYLNGLLAQLKHYLSILALPPDQWIIVADTNVYIHGKLFHEVEWHRVVSVPRASLVMPLVILDELDQVKDQDLEFGKRARSVLRALDNLTNGKDWLDPIRLRQNVWLQLLDEPHGHQRQRGQDDEIVRQAKYFAQLNEGRLILLTRDRGMRLRAQASGLESKTLPEQLERIRQEHA